MWICWSPSPHAHRTCASILANPTCASRSCFHFSFNVGVGGRGGSAFYESFILNFLHTTCEHCRKISPPHDLKFVFWYLGAARVKKSTVWGWNYQQRSGPNRLLNKLVLPEKMKCSVLKYWSVYIKWKENWKRKTIESKTCVTKWKSIWGIIRKRCQWTTTMTGDRRMIRRTDTDG